MAGYLLDTHTWAWSLTNNPNLSQAASTAMNGTEVTAVSPITIFEITQKVRLGKWQEMEPMVHQLVQTLIAQGASIAALTPQIAQSAGLLDWPHCDPFDRIIAATALATNATLISADTAFDSVPGLRRIW